MTPVGSVVSAAVPDAEQLAKVLEADGVLLYDVEGQDLTVVDIWPPHAAAAALKLQVGFGVVGLVARNRAPVLIDEDSPRNAVHRQLLRLEPQQTVARMCLPLPGLQDRVVGVLAVHRGPARPFTPTDLSTAESLATLLGLEMHARQLWRMVSRHRTERDRLIKQAISAQEAERRRIAFDLHDGVTTALASMSFHLSAAELALGELSDRSSVAHADGSVDPGDKVPMAETQESNADLVMDADVVMGASQTAFDSVGAELSTARELADLAYNQTRAAISGLHSLVLDDLGLVAAIESLAQTAGRVGGPKIDLFVETQAAVESIPDHAAAALYRIAQEALNNAVEHASAKRIIISLRRVGDSMVLGCADDGCGFDPAQRLMARAQDAGGEQHFGLSSIAERCAMIEASLRIESVPGRGTTVLVELPLS